MRKQTILRLLVVIVMAIAFVVGFRQEAPCRLNLPQIPLQTTIEGRDNQAVKDFFAPGEKDRATKSLNDALRRVLLLALPKAYKNGCSEMVDQWGAASEGTADLSVRMLYADTKKEGYSIALLAFTCSSGAGEYAGRFRDERLGALVMGPASSRLAMIPQDADCEDCPELVQITPEKDVRIGGKSIVGLNFRKSNENPCCVGGDPHQEERVHFYLLQESGAKAAGSVLKGRVDYAGDGDKSRGKTVYDAGIVFKKDMKGSIVGILSPYTVEKNGRRTDKGMVRYNWDARRGEFVKE